MSRRVWIHLGAVDMQTVLANWPDALTSQWEKDMMLSSFERQFKWLHEHQARYDLATHWDHVSRMLMCDVGFSPDDALGTQFALTFGCVDPNTASL